MAEMKPKELGLLKKDIRKQKASSLAASQKKVKAFAKVSISASARIELSHCMIIFANTIRAARSELDEVHEKADAKIGHLKEALTKVEVKKEKVEVDKVAEKEKRKAMEARVVEIKKGIKDGIAEVG
ncbi:hypothetical protein COCNU_01G014190 [Cocos nucifera]|uniref:Uncharacterized protein n=1 Tax=Cocos nucifera TaxID=13894 RepID=A0A8K0HWG9_COCNU|nr:hypothetical protein COCNU_01G014190 [Cocos nucifera]